MEIIKIAFIGLAGVLLSVYIKQEKSDYALYISIATLLVIFFFMVSKIKIIIASLRELNSYLETKGDYIALILKMTGITYISEFTVSICKDAGYSGIATQIEIFARLTLLLISLPVVMALIETVNSL